MNIKIGIPLIGFVGQIFMNTMLVVWLFRFYLLGNLTSSEATFFFWWVVISFGSGVMLDVLILFTAEKKVDEK